jgi:PAS domain S-box-containing protein
VARLFTRGSRNSRRGNRQLQRRRSKVSQRLRHELETGQIASATAEAIQDAIRPRRTSFWLGVGDGVEPRLAGAAGAPADEGGSDQGLPAVVRECAHRGQSVWNPLLRSLAMPLIGPRSGVMGVLLLEQTSESGEQHIFVEAVAREAGLALEVASQYERAVAEKEKTEAILARVASGVVVTDASGCVLQCNEAAEDILGAEADAVVGLSCPKAIGLHAGEHELDCSNGCPLLAPENGDSRVDRELWRHHPDGRRQPLLASAQALRDADGKLSEIVHSLRDITRLKQADEAKTMFLATATHELKTPLTVIQGFAQTLLDDPRWSEDERRAALEAMHARAQELNKIVDRILLSSRLETGRSRVVIREVDVAPVIADRVGTLRSATKREISTDIVRLPLVLGDPDALATVVDHLLDNAVKYSPISQPIRLDMRARADTVEIEIADRGIGMDREQVAHCFERFWQAESTDVRRFGGTGIGLYIVKSLVDAMDGQISVASAPGRGTTFTISLQRAGVQRRPTLDDRDEGGPLPAEPSVIREFMRQIGVPERGRR